MLTANAATKWFFIILFFNRQHCNLATATTTKKKVNKFKTGCRVYRAVWCTHSHTHCPAQSAWWMSASGSGQLKCNYSTKSLSIFAGNSSSSNGSSSSSSNDAGKTVLIFFARVALFMRTLYITYTENA